MMTGGSGAGTKRAGLLGQGVNYMGELEGMLLLKLNQVIMRRDASRFQFN